MEFLHNYHFVMQYVKSLSINSQGMNQKITIMSQKTLRENLLDYLKQQAMIQGTSKIILPISKKQLADYLGVQRPSLFRELKKLKDEKLIEVDNRIITLHLQT
jgi:CRP-like cAMP-binding protein